ncbi:tripartite tricarboxylate transporter substrate binding protein [Microbacterium sp. NPDC089318]
MKSRYAVIALGAVSVLTLTACSATGATPAADSEGAGAAFAPADVRMIVPFGAGGGSDVSGRSIATGLEGVTDATITVENREGGSGAVGYSHFLAQEGNGNYLLASETALLALPLTTDVDFSYKSFTPIMKLGDDYTLVVVPGDSAFETCTDVVAAAKSDGVIAAVSGAVSLDEVVFSLIEQDQGVTFDRVPFEGGSEVIAGLLGGTVEVGSLNPSEVLGQLESGDLKALCALSEDRYEYDAIADIPTAKEQGIDVAFAQYRGFIAPGGISDEAKQFWINAAKEFAESDDYAGYIEENLMQAKPLYGDDFADYLAQNSADLEAVVGK